MPDTVSLPAPWQIKEAVQILGASKTYLEPIQTALYDHRGVKSQIRFEVIFFALLILALQGRPIHLRQARSVLLNLPRRMQHELNVVDKHGHALSYEQITRTYRRARQIIQTMNQEHLELADDDFAGWLVHKLIRLSRPADMPPPTRLQALDSTDTPGWASTQFRRPTAEDRRKSGTTDRWVPYTPTDPEMGVGYLPAKNNFLKSSLFTGCDSHFITDTTDGPSGTRQPRFINSAAIVTAGTYKAAATLPAISYLKSEVDFSMLVSDGAYTNQLPENWANPLDALGIEQCMNLKIDIAEPHRNRIKGFHSGAVIIDGHPFSPSMPDHLRNLPPHRQLMDPEERAALAREYDRREPYAFTYNGTTTNGRTRWVPPCTRSKVRCPLRKQSLRQPKSVPTAVPPELEVAPLCCTQSSISIPRSAFGSDRQAIRYGTTEWVATYFKRVQVESINSLFQLHYANFTRGHIRCHGRVAHALTVAVIAIAINIQVARRWRREAGLREPIPDDAVVDHPRAFSNPPVVPGAQPILRPTRRDRRRRTNPM